LVVLASLAWDNEDLCFLDNSLEVLV
jgi:hypothetical protein